MASDNEESLARRLRVKFENDSILALYTPLVVALAAGNLDGDTLRNFFAQGLYFIECFAHSLEYTEKFADDDDVKALIIKFRKNFTNHLEGQDDFVKKSGMDYTKDHTANPATVKCTKFVFAMASGQWATFSHKSKIGAYTIAAMMPHIQIYPFIAKRVQALIDADGGTHLFQKWIDYFSSIYHQAFVHEAEALLDKLSVSLVGKELELIEKFYCQAMLRELEFFSTHPMLQITVVPILMEYNPSEHHFMMFSDFDLTCTTVDSFDQMAPMSSAELRNPWGLFSRELTRAYDKTIVEWLCAKYDQYMLKITLADQERRVKNISLAIENTVVNAEKHERCTEKKLFSEGGTIAEKFNYPALKKSFEQLSDLLKGSNREDDKRSGASHVLPDGCKCLFTSISENKYISASIHVLSYRWSYDLMKSVFSSANLNTADIHAYEFKYEESGRKVESPIERVERFGNIRLKSVSDKKEVVVVYIGQSVGDLLCLLEADIGIVINLSESLRRVGTRFGILFVPLFPALVEKQKEMVVGGKPYEWSGKLSGVLYTVSSWDEVHFSFVGS